MDGAERVVDEDITQRGQGLGEGLIIFFFPGVKTKILQQEDVPSFILATIFRPPGPYNPERRSRLSPTVVPDVSRPGLGCIWDRMLLSADQDASTG